MSLVQQNVLLRSSCLFSKFFQKEFSIASMEKLIVENNDSAAMFPQFLHIQELLAVGSANLKGQLGVK